MKGKDIIVADLERKARGKDVTIEDPRGILWNWTQPPLDVRDSQERNEIGVERITCASNVDYPGTRPVATPERKVPERRSHRKENVERLMLLGAEDTRCNSMR